MLIMAERINSSHKQIAQAIAAGDRAFIQAESKAQTLYEQVLSKHLNHDG